MRQQILFMLDRTNLKLAVAESLTAGKVSALIASESGISKYYQGSVTAYTCDIKNKVLGVDKEWLDKFLETENKDESFKLFNDDSEKNFEDLYKEACKSLSIENYNVALAHFQKLK